jgi:hypothetical protein
MARRDGNRIYFDQSETESIAKGAKAIKLAASLMPDPTSASIVMPSVLCSLWARSAVRRNKCLGLHLPGYPDIFPASNSEISTYDRVFRQETAGVSLSVIYPFEYRPADLPS